MSVTFTASFVEPRFHVVSCGCEEATARAVPYGSFGAAHSAAEAANLGARAPLPGCALPEVCPDYPLYARPVYEDPAPETCLHEANAERALEVLGLRTGTPACPQQADADLQDGAEHEASGQMDAEEFLGRVLVAVALAPADSGADGYWSGRWFHGGRHAGDLQQRLGELRLLAEWCHQRGRQVAWG